jgi:glycosyltransferase involved in cell wall biosynthesis
VLAGLRHADSVIAPTAAFLSHFARCYPESDFRGRSRVIYNGVDPAGWPAGRRRTGSSFVLAVGRVWDEGKNLSRLAEVAPALPCPVLVAGEGRLAKCPDKLRLLGNRPRSSLSAYYRGASVYAHPARYEPFGLSVLEAAFSGCPLMLADIPSLRELWDGAACFADPGDTAAWREGLRELLGNAGRRADLGFAARQRAERYTAARMAAVYSQHYRHMLLRSEDAVA